MFQYTTRYIYSHHKTHAHTQTHTRALYNSLYILTIYNSLAHTIQLARSQYTIRSLTIYNWLAHTAQLARSQYTTCSRTIYLPPSLALLPLACAFARFFVCTHNIVSTHEKAIFIPTIYSSLLCMLCAVQYTTRSLTIYDSLCRVYITASCML